MWAICDINKISSTHKPLDMKRIEYSDSLTQHGGSSGISQNEDIPKIEERS